MILPYPCPESTNPTELNLRNFQSTNHTEHNLENSQDENLVMGRGWSSGPGLGQAGPGRSARPGPSLHHVVGRGPARPINVLENQPVGRLGSRAAAVSGPSIFSVDGLRPGTAHQISNYVCPAHDIPSEAHEARALYGPTRGFEELAHGWPTGWHVY